MLLHLTICIMRKFCRDDKVTGQVLFVCIHRYAHIILHIISTFVTLSFCNTFSIIRINNTHRQLYIENQ